MAAGWLARLAPVAGWLPTAITTATLPPLPIARGRTPGIAAAPRVRTYPCP